MLLLRPLAETHHQYVDEIRSCTDTDSSDCFLLKQIHIFEHCYSLCDAHVDHTFSLESSRARWHDDIAPKRYKNIYCLNYSILFLWKCCPQKVLHGHIYIIWTTLYVLNIARYVHFALKFRIKWENTQYFLFVKYFIHTRVYKHRLYHGIEDFGLIAKA